MDAVIKGRQLQFQRRNHLVWKIMLWKKVRSSAMLAFPPRPKFCPQGESRQSEVETDVSPMQPVYHILTQLEVEQMPRSWAGQLFEGGREEKEPVVEG